MNIKSLPKPLDAHGQLAIEHACVFSKCFNAERRFFFLSPAAGKSPLFVEDSDPLDPTTLRWVFCPARGDAALCDLENRLRSPTSFNLEEARLMGLFFSGEVLERRSTVSRPSGGKNSGATTGSSMLL